MASPNKTRLPEILRNHGQDTVLTGHQWAD
jgi:hypothetical protein